MGKIVKDKCGNEYEYDSNNNLIHFRNSDEYEYWYTYNSYGVQTSHLTNPNTTQESLWK